MEFSEAFELNRMLKFSKSPLHISTTHKDSGDRNIELNSSIENDLFYSPPNTPPPDVVVHQVPRTLDNNKSAQPASPLLQIDSPIEIERDESYKRESPNSMRKLSSLTQSLMRTDLGKEDFLSSDMLQLKVFLFGSMNDLWVTVPKNATGEQLIAKIISIYSRSSKSKDTPLPHGPTVEAYELYMVDDDTNLPEYDFLIDRKKRINDLGVDSLAFCVFRKYSLDTKPKEIDDYPIERSGSGIQLKIDFEGNLVRILADPQTTLKDILRLVQEKNTSVGYLNPDDYQFKIEVSLEEVLQQEECIVDMNLQIKNLSTNDLKLSRRKFVDSPIIEIPKPLSRRNTPLVKEEAKFDPDRHKITKAQACAYQEFIVIKTNKRGKRQNRVLGVDQLRLYNMTPFQAKQNQNIKQKAVGKGQMRKKLEGIFKRVTHHPEIPIANIHKIEQDANNLSCFYIEYTEGNNRKNKLYETENSIIAAEVMAKISQLMKLVIFI